jgi:acyl carrier protein
VSALIFERLRDLIAEQFSVSPELITLDTAFVDDLGADSLDIVELTMALEEEFDIPEADEDEMVKLNTVGDVVNFIQEYI